MLKIYRNGYNLDYKGTEALYCCIILLDVIFFSDLHSKGSFHRHLFTHHRGEGELLPNIDDWYYDIEQSTENVNFFHLLFIFPAQISKPSNPGRLGKASREQDTHAAHSEQVLSVAHSVNKNSKKQSGQVWVQI